MRTCGNIHTGACGGPGADETVTVLRIGARHARIVHGKRGPRTTCVRLPLGSAKTAEDYFRREPPTAYELEAAIAGIEDIVMPVRAQLTPGSRLVTADPLIRKILEDFLASTRGSWPIETIEAVFRELSAAAHGAAPWRYGNDGAAVILILREFMHHLDFDAIQIIGSDNHWDEYLCRVPDD